MKFEGMFGLSAFLELEHGRRGDRICCRLLGDRGSVRFTELRNFEIPATLALREMCVVGREGREETT